MSSSRYAPIGDKVRIFVIRKTDDFIMLEEKIAQNIDNNLIFDIDGHNVMVPATAEFMTPIFTEDGRISFLILYENGNIYKPKIFEDKEEDIIEVEAKDGKEIVIKDLEGNEKKQNKVKFRKIKKAGFKLEQIASLRKKQKELAELVGDKVESFWEIVNKYTNVAIIIIMLIGTFLVVSSVMTTTKNMTETMNKMIKENAKYNAQILQILNEMKNKTNTPTNKSKVDNSQYQVTNKKPKEVIVHGNLPDKMEPVPPVNEITPPS